MSPMADGDSQVAGGGGGEPLVAFEYGRFAARHFDGDAAVQGVGFPALDVDRRRRRRRRRLHQRRLAASGEA